ncbi:DNA repair protein RAD51 homolog 4 isoform X3 [Rhineura floridana]|uniref:DNA repair protein RAD51 homolog 4 isoform X3 n=1 Tax=Rhineura floridana TaxID=261503 RepID=UPI002AC834A7|nr:DNA repair protein RAD51 homolog 4 isoform X3 [Rhineura floridana]
MILRVGLCPGLTAEMVQLLKTSGINTVVDLVSSDLEEVAQKCSLSYKALVAIRRVLLAHFASFPVNGADLYEELKNATAILSTGSKSLDKILDSGLYTGEVTEFMGTAGAGKTQVCLSIAVNVSHNLKQNVLYIDSMGGFTASRLLQLLQDRTENEEEQVEALQRVQIVRVFDAYKMLDALQDFRSSMAHQVMSASGPVKVLVIDSVSAVIYPLLGTQQPDACWDSGRSGSGELGTEGRQFDEDWRGGTMMEDANECACLLSSRLSCKMQSPYVESAVGSSGLQKERTVSCFPEY